MIRGKDTCVRCNAAAPEVEAVAGTAAVAVLGIAAAAAAVLGYSLVDNRSCRIRQHDLHRRDVPTKRE